MSETKTRLSAQERDLIAYYHLRSCAWVPDERRACDCGLVDRVEAIVSRPDNGR